jgi:tetratricopeptide (TPR) repeat protein
MRRTLFSASFVAGVLASAAALAMAGGGYGGFSNMPQQSFDDYAIARRLIKHEEYAKAIPHLMAALKQRPKSADILNYLGYTHRMVGVSETAAARDNDFKLSLGFYQMALEIDPSHKGVHEYLGELYLAMNDVASAHREMDTLTTLCPDGCEERDTLQKALAAYVPPAP